LTPVPSHTRSLPEPTRIDTGPWRGWAVEPFPHSGLQQFLADPLALFILPETHQIKVSRNRLTSARYTLEGETYRWVVKEFSNQSPGAFLKNAWRTSKAQKGWEKARALLARGIETPMPRLALDRRLPFGLVETSVLVVDDVGEVVQLRQILKDLRASRESEIGRKPSHRIEKESFLDSLARFIRHMHDYGVLHRDLSGGNILVRLLDKGGWAFALVDINRAKIAPNLRPDERLLDLERINIDPEDRAFFFAAYAKGSSRLLSLEAEYVRRVDLYRRYREGEGTFWYKLTHYLPSRR
jgi:hypothetical protein